MILAKGRKVKCWIKKSRYHKQQIAAKVFLKRWGWIKRLKLQQLSAYFQKYLEVYKRCHFSYLF